MQTPSLESRIILSGVFQLSNQSTINGPGLALPSESKVGCGSMTCSLRGNRFAVMDRPIVAKFGWLLYILATILSSDFRSPDVLNR